MNKHQNKRKSINLKEKRKRTREGNHYRWIFLSQLHRDEHQKPTYTLPHHIPPTVSKPFFRPEPSGHALPRLRRPVARLIVSPKSTT